METEEHSTSKAPLRPMIASWGPRLTLLVSLGVILGIVLTSPGFPLGWANRVGYAVCHQLPTHTYFFGNRPLPLCARCSGQYLAALGGLLWLLIAGSGRAGRLPRPPLALILLSFLGLWAFDGINSLLSSLPGLPHLYEPRNLIRLSTGALAGLALAALFTPFFNRTIWRYPSDRATLRSWRELLGWVSMAVLIILTVQSQWWPLLYPAALLSALGVLTLLTMVNSMVAALALRRDGMAETWLDAIFVLAPGLALTLTEILVIGLIRSALALRLGLPV